jgi:hypothetical protein
MTRNYRFRPSGWRGAGGSATTSFSKELCKGTRLTSGTRCAAKAVTSTCHSPASRPTGAYTISTSG